MTTLPTPLAGGVFETAELDGDAADLRRLVDDIGRRASDRRPAHPTLHEPLDDQLWGDLEKTDLTGLVSTATLEAGPTELAIVLCGLARHSGAAPVAETDLLARWLAASAGLSLPQTGPLTVAIANAHRSGDRIAGVAVDVPWAQASSAVVLAAWTNEALHVTVLDDRTPIDDGHNLAGEPRDRIEFDLPADGFRNLDQSVGEEVLRRGAWARCVQTIGAFDGAALLTVAHTRERVQFGRPVSQFQSVQHALAAMAGEIERARAATTLAVAAAADHGFAAAHTDYAVTVAKVAVGRAVGPVTTIAHQLHGAIGVTAEHRLWRYTMPAHSWAREFGSTAHHARRLGRIVLSSTDPWDALIGSDLSGWTT